MEAAGAPGGANGAEPAATPGGEYASRLEPVDEALEHLLLQLIDSNFVLTDPHGSVTRWGDKARLLFGLDTDEIVGESIFTTMLAHGDEGTSDAPVNSWQHYLETRAGERPPARFTIRARHGEDKVFSCELTFIPVRLIQGPEFSFFVRDLAVDIAAGAKLARLRRDHTEVLELLSQALAHGVTLDPEERLAGVLVAFHSTGSTPWVEAALREAEEAAAALAEVTEVAGEVDEAAASKLAETLAHAKRAEREVEETKARQETMRADLDAAVGRADELGREGVEMRERLEAAEQRAAQARAEAEQALKTARELVDQSRGDSGDADQRLAALERVAEAERERVSRLEREAQAERERVASLERSSEAERERLAAFERAGEAERQRLSGLERASEELRRLLETAEQTGAHSQEEVDEARRHSEQVRAQIERAEREGAAAREEARRLEGRLEEAIARLEQARADTPPAPAPAAPISSGDAQSVLQGLEREVQTLSGRLDSVRSQGDAAATRLEELGRAVEDALQRAAEAAEGASSARGEVTEARERLREAQQGAAAVVAELNESRRAADAARAAGDELERATERARAEATGASEQAAAARAELEHARTELRSVHQDLETARTATDAARREADAARDQAAEARRESADASAAAERARRELAGAKDAAQAALKAAAELRDGTVSRPGDTEDIRTELEQARAEAAAMREEFKVVSRQIEGVRTLFGGADADSALSSSFGSDSEPEQETQEETGIREPREGFDDAREPMALLDLDGRFLELNARFSELIGYSEQEFRSAKWPSSLSDESTRAAHKDLLQGLVTGKVAEGEVETCYLHKEGLLVPVAGKLSVLRGENGNPERLLLAGLPAGVATV